MLRLLKKYTFGYHFSESRHSQRVPTRSIFMSSYPGALSSHDEYYVARGITPRKNADDNTSDDDDDDFFILTAVPLKNSSPNPSTFDATTDNHDEQFKDPQNSDESVSIPCRIRPNLKN